MKVYLAGPITGVDPLEPDWRDEAEQLLAPDRIISLRPTAMARYEQMYGIKRKYSEMVLTVRDHKMCTGADVVLANFEGSTVASIGTSMELGWASEAGVPIIGVVPNGNIHCHAMILSVLTFRAYNLDEGLRIVQSLAGERL